MAKTQSTDTVATICFALILVGFVTIAVSFVGCGGSPAKHFGSGDAGLSTGTGGDPEPAGTGGASASGGATATGGVVAASGGTSGSGGAIGSGGRPATGGDPGSGGVLAAGGRLGTGGAASGGHGSGGNGSGGASSGGSGSGGASSGGSGTGGAATGGTGTGGAGTGGAGTGGTATGGAGTGGAGTGGAASGGSGSGGAGTGGAGTGGAGTGGATSKCRLIVNEIQTTGALGDSDEYVELYNSCSDPIDVSGYALSYRSAGNNSGGADNSLYVFPADSKVGGAGFIVIAGARFPGGAGGRITNGGLALAGGAVAIRNASGAVVDSVAYDRLTVPNNFTEGSAAPNPPEAASIVRVPNGADTDNNARDFQISLLPTPGASNL